MALSLVAVLALAGTPRAAAQTPAAQVQSKNEASDGTVLADREIHDCTFKQPPAKNGPPPPPELARLLIRCLFEQPSIPGGDGAVTIDIERLDIGRPRRWNPDQDVGSGNHATLVYPVHAAWTRKTFHRAQTTIQSQDATFPCHVTLIGTWACEHAQRITDAETRRIPVK